MNENDGERSYWWVSWYQPTDDMRPLKDPPHEQVLGWWCSGQRLVDNAPTLCAHVQADTQKAVKDIIAIDWPEAMEWRFCQVTDHMPPGDRFPVNDGWMKERYEREREHAEALQG